MKRIFWIMFSFLTTVILFSSCEKHVFDYRNKFVGDWRFTVTVTEYQWNTIPQNTTEVIVYDGRIEYAPLDDQITIYYLPDYSRTLYINKKGDICTETRKMGEMDRINFSFKEDWGGRGSHWYHNVTGVAL
jgi:hypothetical protein